MFLYFYFSIIAIGKGKFIKQMAPYHPVKTGEKVSGTK